MTKRVVLAGIAGGIAMFVFLAAAHMSPLGMIGLQYFPREAIVVETLEAESAGLRDGMYVFPAEAALAAPDRPSGMLVYHPTNMFTMMTQQILAEGAKEIVQAILLAYLLAQIAGGFARRMRFTAVAGAMAAIATNGSYLIWYGMPADYTLVSIALELVGYLIAGAVIALLYSRARDAQGVPATA